MIMKDRNAILLLLTIFLFLFSCKRENNIIESGYESYRYELWKKLIDHNYQFDFIGTKKDIGSYPEYLGHSFDVDHEGKGGIESGGVLNNMSSILSTISTPDIVLLGVGGNDFLNGGKEPSETIGNINQIIDLLQNNNPNVTIFLEQIAPARADIMSSDLASNIEEFNTEILIVAGNQTDSNSVVIPIDMNTDFSKFYFADEVHYNKHGALFIANKYFNAIEAQSISNNNLTILALGDSRVEGNRP